MSEIHFYIVQHLMKGDFTAKELIEYGYEFEDVQTALRIIDYLRGFFDNEYLRRANERH